MYMIKHFVLFFLLKQILADGTNNISNVTDTNTTTNGTNLPQYPSPSPSSQPVTSTSPSPSNQPRAFTPSPAPSSPTAFRVPSPSEVNIPYCSETNGSETCKTCIGNTCHTATVHEQAIVATAFAMAMVLSTVGISLLAFYLCCIRRWFNNSYVRINEDDDWNGVELP